jgi:hypothetical protein
MKNLKDKLYVGAYYLHPYAQTEQHIKDLKDCGIDYVVGLDYNKQTLDLFNRYDIGAIIRSVVPFWVGGDGKNAGKMRETFPISEFEKGAEGFVDHPAIWMVDVCDEPSALEFPYLSEVISKVEKLFPNQKAYLNLYPNYAQVASNTDTQMVNQLGTTTYAEHIEKYCQTIPLDYLSYDFYIYVAGVALAYENLRIVADACLKTGRDLWIILQVNSLYPERWISEDQLRFQAFSAMAFGARNICWACYTAGWWHNQVLDDKGDKTEQYDKLKKVNAEIANIGKEFIKYRCVSTHFIGFKESADLSRVKQAPINELNTGAFKEVRTDGDMIVGQMVNYDDGNNALMVCAADDYKGENKKISKLFFKTEKMPIVYGGDGIIPLQKENGEYVLELCSSQGALIALN